MSKKNFWILFAVFTGLFFFVKYQSPQIVHFLYHHHLDFLNQMTATSVSRVLDYYLGRVEDWYTGPLQTLISGLLLMSFCLVYGKGMKLWRLTFVFLIYFFITRFEVWLYPPYGELVMGPLAPAYWLATHHFDYSSLLAQDSFTTGGPRTYETSLFPPIVAALMMIFSSTKMFLFLFHAIVFALAAGIAALLKELLAKFYDEDIALLGAVLLVSLPLWQSMSEQLNIGMPHAFFAVLSVQYMFQRRFASASIAAVFSSLFKAPGAITCAVLCLAVGVLFVTSEERLSKRIKSVLWGLLALGVGAINFIVRSRLMGDQPAHNKVDFLSGWPYMSHMAVTWLYLASLIAFWGYLIKEFLELNDKSEWRLLFNRHLNAIIMFAMAGAWYGLYLNFSVMGYRYEVLLAPFLVFCLMFVVFLFIKQRNARVWTLIASIVFALICSYGLLYDRNIPSSIYSYHDYERSLEYRNDIKMHMALGKEMEENYADYLIAAPHVVAHKFGIYQFGYVNQPLDVMIYGMRCTYGGIKNFTGLSDIDIARTIWIGFEKNHISDNIDFPIGPQDRLIKRVTYGDKEALIFQGGFAVEKVRLMIEMSRRQKILQQKLFGQ
jgi:hypothetical protein